MGRQAKVYRRQKTTEEVFEERIKGFRRKDTIIHLIVSLVSTALIVFLLFGFMFGISIVQGDSMFPNYYDQDVVLLWRLDHLYVPGQIVVFRMDGKEYIKRVVALAGDVVDIDNESGTVLVNGEPSEIGDNFYPSHVRKGDVTFPYVVPDNSLFVMGDYRTVSKDSREYGAILKTQVLGKAITTLRFRSEAASPQ